MRSVPKSDWDYKPKRYKTLLTARGNIESAHSYGLRKERERKVRIKAEIVRSLERIKKKGD